MNVFRRFALCVLLLAAATARGAQNASSKPAPSKDVFLVNVSYWLPM